LREIFHAGERYTTYKALVWGTDVQIDWNGKSGYSYFDTSAALFSTSHAIQDYSENAINDFIRKNSRTANVFSGSVILNYTTRLPVGLYNIDGSNYIKLRDAATMLSLANVNIDVV